MKKADNKIESPNFELSEFKKSWVAKQNLLFFSKSDDTHFMVHSALPCYERNYKLCYFNQMWFKSASSTWGLLQKQIYQYGKNGQQFHRVE